MSKEAQYSKAATIGDEESGGVKQLITNPNYEYANSIEKYQGYLSKQFPTTANPAPLGLCGFALTCFVLSCMNAGGLVSIHASNGVVNGLALFYGGLIQFLAGMWEFKCGNTFGATFFGSYGMFWMSFAALSVQCWNFMGNYTSEKDAHDGLGIFLLSWAMFTTFNIFAAHRSTIALIVLLLLVDLVFLMLSISNFTFTTFPTISIRCQEAGGCFGVMAAFLAWYCSFSALLTNQNSLVILPIGPLDPIYRSWGWTLPDEVPEKK